MSEIKSELGNAVYNVELYCSNDKNLTVHTVISLVLHKARSMGHQRRIKFTCNCQLAWFVNHYTPEYQHTGKSKR